jgi:hypothetical protein
VQTGTPVPRKNSEAFITHPGFTQHARKPNWAASSQSFLMSDSDASGLSSVWSIRLAQSCAVAVSPSTIPIRSAPASTMRSTVGPAKRRAVLIATELCDHHVGDLVNELFVVAVCGHL